MTKRSPRDWPLAGERVQAVSAAMQNALRVAAFHRPRSVFSDVQNPEAQPTSGVARGLLPQWREGTPAGRFLSELHGHWQLTKSERAAAIYLGWVGHGNLGDEALFDVFEREFAPLKLWGTHAHPLMMRWLETQKKNPWKPRALILGGGTLVGRSPWMSRLACLHERFPGSALWALGVGVEDPEELAAGSRTLWEQEMAVLRTLAPRFHGLTTRGPRSSRILEAAGIHAPWAGDPAILLGPAAPGDPAAVEERSLLLSVGQVDGLSGAVLARFLVELEAAMRVLLAQGWSLRILPVSPFDEALSASFFKRLGPGGRVHLLARTSCWRTFQQIASRHTLGVHLRLHPAVLSAGCFSPAIQLSYLPKCADFLESLASALPSMALAEVQARALAARVLEVAAHRSEHVCALAAAVGSLRMRVRGHLESLKN